MKLTVESSAIRPVLARACKVTPRRSPSPVLQCVMLHADKGDGTLAVRAASGEIYSYDDVPAVVTQPGSVLVDAALLASALKHIDGTIEMSVRVHSLVIVGGGMHYALPFVHHPSSFPTAGEVKGESVAINGDELRAAIKACEPTISKETSRYAINGALLVLGREAALVSTDGRALTIHKLGGAGKGNHQAVLPANALAMLADTDAEEIALTLGPTLARFEAAGWCITTALVEGTFPPYKDIIPKDDAMTVRVELPADGAASAIRAVAAVCSEERRGVRVNVNGTVTLTGGGGDCTATATVDAKSGGEGAITLNPDYFAGLADGAVMRFGLPTKPITLERGPALRVVMPINEGGGA